MRANGRTVTRERMAAHVIADAPFFAGIDPGPHKGVGPGGVGNAQSAKASSIVLMLFLLLHRHAVVMESPATKSIC